MASLSAATYAQRVIPVLALVLASVALLIGLITLALAVTVTRRLGTRDPIAVSPGWRRVLRIHTLPVAMEGDFLGGEVSSTKVAFIANPTKPGVADVREQALRACSNRYMPQPMWLYTTEDDPGDGAARRAVKAGADLVVAVGGDGTVRAAAAGLAGTDVPLGIVPMGTGNLLARNIDLPLGDVTAQLRIALEGRDHRIDVGWLELDDDEDNPQIFLVMAGAGIDAEMVAGADDRLKRRLGWLAYFFSAIKHMGARRMRAAISVDGSSAVIGRMRTVLFANVGRLPGGFQLVPEASEDDGSLDIVSLDARRGIVGWTELFGTVVAQGAGLKQSEIAKAYGASRIDSARGARARVTTDHAHRVQADGEDLGTATRITAYVDAGALVVRRKA